MCHASATIPPTTDRRYGRGLAWLMCRLHGVGEPDKLTPNLGKYTALKGFSSDAFPPLRSDGAGCVLCPRSRDIRADGHRVGVPPRDQKRGRRRQGASHQPLPALARPFRATLADPEIVAPPQADFSTEQLDEKALATLATVRRRPHAPRARDASPNVPDLRFPLSARSSGSTS
jgi:hypothetical protein